MRGRKTAAIAALTTGTLGLVAGPAAAADPVGCDDLQAALEEAASPIYLSGKACPGQYTIRRSLTLVGVDGGGFKAGAEGGRSLLVDNRADVVLEKLSFAGTGELSGGVDYSDDVDNDLELRAGRADAAEAGDLSVLGSTFTGNGAYEGGGLYALTTDDGSVTIRQSTFTGNTAVDDGGGAAVYSPRQTVEGSTFADNEAEGSGGGLAARLADLRPFRDAAGPGVTITGSTFARNTLIETGDSGWARQGGGLYVEGPAVDDRKRRAPIGGATLADNTVTGNVIEAGPGMAQAGGGAAFRNVAVVSSADELTGNVVGNGNGEVGGGVALVHLSDGMRAPSDSATFEGVNTVVSGNAVGGDDGIGGGIGTSFTPPRWEERRRAAEEGGSEIAIDLTHATVTGNTATRFGPAIGADKYTDLDVDASIVWDNTLTAPEVVEEPGEDDPLPRAGAVREIDGWFGQRSIARSVLCDVEPATLRADPDENGNLCVDPKLADAASGDVHLLAGSPAIDAVGARAARASESVLVDYEGDARPFNGVRDMGADEYTVKTDPDPDPEQQGQGQGQPSTQRPGGQVLGQTATARPTVCAGKRFFRITLRKSRGPFKAAKIWVNGKRVKVTITRRGRATTRVDLRKLPRRVIRVRIVATRTTGTTIRGKRVYNPCRPSLDNGVPPKL